MTERPDASRTEQIIEAVLFAAGYPITYQKLSEILMISPETVKKTVACVADRYDGSGIAVLMYDKACQMCTREGYESYIREALGIKRGGSLSNSSLEVLAIIAYHQPVTRQYIEQIRGVDSSYAVNSLVEKGLIERRGRLDVPGRPSIFGTTPDFLRCFGLRSLSELPTVDVLKTEQPIEAANSEQTENNANSEQTTE